MNNKSAPLPLTQSHYSDDWDEAIPGQPSATAPADMSMGKETSRPALSASSEAEKRLDDDLEVDPIAFPIKHDAAYFPAITARTSLFCVNRIARDDDPDEMKNPVKVELSGQNGYKLTAWGPRLNMHDKLVWETAVQIAFENQHGFGARFAITLRDFSRRMGKKSGGGASLKWIWHSLRRLYHIRLEFEMPNGVKGGGSILSTALHDENGNFMLRLNPDFCAPVFFNDNRFLIKVQRRNLLVNQLSKWLHDFLSTHNGFEVVAGAKNSSSPQNAGGRELKLSFARIRELAGYGGTRGQFAKDLIRSIGELVIAAPDLVAGYEVIKEGRASDTWKLRIVRGSEKPAYLIPEMARTERDLSTAAPFKKPKRTSKGNGGVVL